MLAETGMHENVWYSLVCILIGYLFGCIATGYFVGKKNNVDIQKEGSGNPGATNALRIMGLKSGLITLIGDLIKSLIPCLLVRHVFFPGFVGTGYGWFSTEYYVLLTGLAAVIGHNYPSWLRFKGGKGISTSAGVMFALNLPMTGILAVILFSVIGISKYVSLGSITVLVFVPILIGVFYPGKWVLVVLGAVFMIIGWWRHRANIGRLLHGNENRLSVGGKK